MKFSCKFQQNLNTLIIKFQLKKTKILDLNDTTLFRLLAEKAMIHSFNEEDKQHDTQTTKAWQTNNNNHQMRADLVGSQQSINKLNS